MDEQKMQTLLLFFLFNTVAFQRLASVITDVAKQYLSVFLFNEISHLSTKQI